MIEAIELTSTRRSRHAGGGPVENVSFDVYPGQVTALLGAPGAGKSTVLRLMAELEPGAGRTLFGGRPYRALKPAVREVGLALNPDAVHPGRTVQAHLQLYAAAGGVPKPRVAEVLEVSGLSTLATVRCGRLDPSQRQRLSIAAALIGDPAALILDEPLALDTHGMSWFHALIRAYAAQGRTVLVAATDPDTLSGTADHVVILRRDEHDGISRVIASRSAAEVFDERRATVVQVRSPQAARLAAALEAEGASLAPAGPGALQVRGLDRARIGEVAHVAGVCLHELSEIGHDDDVFGLRPVPRQKELLPGLNRSATTWHSGVRMLADEIEEAEVIEAAAEASAEAEEPAPESVGAQAAGAVAVQAEAGEHVSQGPVTGSSESAVKADAGQAQADQQAQAGGEVAAKSSQRPAAAQSGSKPIGSWRTQGSVAGSHWSAVKGSQQQSAVSRQIGASAVDGSEELASSPAPNTGAPALADTATASPSAAHPSSAEPAAAASSSATATSAAQSMGAPTSAATFASIGLPSTTGSAAVVSSAATAAAAVLGMAAPSSEGMAAPTPASAKARQTHRRSTFGVRWGRSRPHAAAEASSEAVAVEAPVLVQPAVPFTVALPAAEQDASGEGMTPWRAVAARAAHGQHGSQEGSVAEAAPAEQEASA